MNKVKILKDLEAFKVGYANEGAAYLMGIYKTFEDEHKRLFLDWLEEVLNKDNLPRNIELSIGYFWQEIHFTPENVKRWVQLAQKDTERTATFEAQKIKKDLELMPDKEGKTAYLRENHAFWFKEMKRKGAMLYDPQRGIDRIVNNLVFIKQRSGKLPTIPDLSIADYSLPSDKVRATVSPALKAKRIVELINDLMQNIDKPPAVCSVIPKKMLVDFYQTFSDFLTDYSEEEFINAVYSDNELIITNRAKTILLFCIQELANSLGLKNSLIIKKLSGGKYGNIASTIVYGSRQKNEVKAFLLKYGINCKDL